MTDFNGDGLLDLAVASYLADGTISVWLGNGDGTFRQLRYPVGSGPYGVDATDVNLDGNQDLLVSNYNDSTMSVLLGNGDGTFQPQMTYPTGEGPDTIATGDFNNDGIPDAFVGSLGGALLLGNGDGTFQSSSPSFPSVYSYAAGVGDYNRDGKLDLAVGYTTGIFHDGIVQILFGNGDGTFEAGPSYSIMVSTPYSIAVDDLNHDGQLDMAVTTFGLAVAVLLGHGDGTFTQPAYYTTPKASYGVAIADFNRDGNPDLAVGNFDLPSQLSTFTAKGDGTFFAAINYTLSDSAGYADAVAAGDFNNDGSPDIALANSSSDNLSIFLNTGGTLLRAKSSPNPSKVGQKVTVTAQVRASVPNTGSPTGTVIFKDGTKSAKVTLVDGSASFSTSTLTQGTHTITVSYSGDKNFNPNSAKPLLQVVNP